MQKQFLLTTSWDDGSSNDLKLAELLDKYDIPATFYVPTRNSERRVMTKDQIRAISEDFEIGGHTLNHEELTKVNRRTVEREIVGGKKELESIIGRKVESFSYPKGRQNSEIKQLVGFSGFKFARTTALFGTSVGDKLLASTTIHAYNHNPMVYFQHGVKRKLFYTLVKDRKIYFDWGKLAKSCLDWCLENNGIFHLWGHSWEIEERGDWGRLESVFAYISEVVPKNTRKTNIEVLGELEKRKRQYYDELDPKQYKRTLETSYYNSELEFIRKLVRNSDRKGKRILDIGCGIGRVSTLFKKASYTGIDFAKNFIDFAKETYKRGRFLTEDYKKLEKLKLGKQDLIVIWGMFEDQTDPLVVLETLKPLIKSGSRIIFTLHNLKNPIFRAVQALKTEFFHQPFPFTSFAPEFIRRKVRDYCRRNGFNYEILSFGSFPPANKFVPGITGNHFGASLVVVLDKK